MKRSASELGLRAWELLRECAVNISDPYKFRTILFDFVVYPIYFMDTRSQGLSSSRPLERERGGKMRGPGNEVAAYTTVFWARHALLHCVRGNVLALVATFGERLSEWSYEQLLNLTASFAGSF